MGASIIRRLPDGTAVALRPFEPEDAALLGEIFDHLGPTSRYQRYLVPKHRLTAYELRVLSAVDHVRHEAVVALSVPEGRPLGVARFVRESARTEVAEVAVEVVDSWHRRGVGSLLTEALVLRAVDLRVHELAAVLAHGNTGAVRLLQRVPGHLDRITGTSGLAEYRVVLRDAC